MYDLNLQKETFMPAVTNYSEVHKIFLAFTLPSQSFAASRLNDMKLMIFNYFFNLQNGTFLGVNLHIEGKTGFQISQV